MRDFTSQPSIRSRRLIKNANHHKETSALTLASIPLRQNPLNIKRKPLSLQDLPFEIQRPIIIDCVSYLPAVVELKIGAGLSTVKARIFCPQQALSIQGKRKIPDSINMALMDTCRFYRREGKKLWWQENRFLVTVKVGVIRALLFAYLCCEDKACGSTVIPMWSGDKEGAPILEILFHALFVILLQLPGNIR